MNYNNNNNYYYNYQPNRAVVPPQMMPQYANVQMPAYNGYNPIPMAQRPLTANPPRQKKILSIVDPATCSLVNGEYTAQQLGLPEIPTRAFLTKAQEQSSVVQSAKTEERVVVSVFPAEKEPPSEEFEEKATTKVETVAASDEDSQADESGFDVDDEPAEDEQSEEPAAEQKSLTLADCKQGGPPADIPEDENEKPPAVEPLSDTVEKDSEPEQHKQVQDEGDQATETEYFSSDVLEDPADNECVEQTGEVLLSSQSTVEQPDEVVLSSQPAVEVELSEETERIAAYVKDDNIDLKDSISDEVVSDDDLEVLCRRVTEYKSTFDASALIYDRTFFAYVGEYIKKTNHIECVVTEEKLTEIGIDAATMPAEPPTMKKKKPQQSGNFTQFEQKKSFEQKKHLGLGRGFQGRSNEKYQSFQKPTSKHHSTEKDFVFERQKPLQPTLKAEKPWKPIKKDTVDEATKTAKDIRGLLNKITPTTIEALTAKFLEYEVYKCDSIRTTALDILFEKAVEEPRFCPIYSDLCKAQVADEFEKHQTSSFRTGILNKAQATFEGNNKNAISELQTEISAEEEEDKKKELKLKLLGLKAKEKRRVHGNIGFIGELFRHHLLTAQVVNCCIVQLVKADESAEVDEPSVECAVKMLASVGKSLQLLRKEERPKATEVVEMCLAHLSSKASSGRYCARIRFMILDLAELKANNWIPRKSADSGPKTMQEIQKDVQNEEMEKQAEREQYEQRRFRPNNNFQGRRDNQTTPYPPNASQNVYRSNNQNQYKANAAQTANRQTVRPFKPTNYNGQPQNKMSLKQVDTNQSLSSGRKWGKGAVSGQ